MSARRNKYSYLWVVQGYYGHGWEDLTASEDRREAGKLADDYRANTSDPIRKILRRVAPDA